MTFLSFSLWTMWTTTDIAPSTPARNAETLTLLTAGTFAVFIVADREEWETRDILFVVVVSPSSSFCLYATKVFPLLVKAKYPPSATLHGERLALEWSTMGCLPRRMDRSRKRHYGGMDGRCLTVAATWERFQSGPRNIGRINVVRAMLFPTRRSDILILRGYLVHRTIFSRLISRDRAVCSIAELSIANYKLSTC